MSKQREWPNSGGPCEFGKWHPAWSRLAWRERIRHMEHVAMNETIAKRFREWGRLLDESAEAAAGGAKASSDCPNPGGFTPAGVTRWGG